MPDSLMALGGIRRGGERERDLFQDACDNIPFLVLVESRKFGYFVLRIDRATNLAALHADGQHCILRSKVQQSGALDTGFTQNGLYNLYPRGDCLVEYGVDVRIILFD
jgi:hypothetical protein